MVSSGFCAKIRFVCFGFVDCYQPFFKMFLSNGESCLFFSKDQFGKKKAQFVWKQQNTIKRPCKGKCYLLKMDKIGSTFPRICVHIFAPSLGLVRFAAMTILHCFLAFFRFQEIVQQGQKGMFWQHAVFSFCCFFVYVLGCFFVVFSLGVGHPTSPNPSLVCFNCTNVFWVFGGGFIFSSKETKTLFCSFAGLGVVSQCLFIFLNIYIYIYLLWSYYLGHVWGFLIVTNWATFVFFEKAVCQKNTIKIGVSADLSFKKKGTQDFY